MQMNASGLIVAASERNAQKTEAHDQLMAYVKVAGTVEWPKLMEYAAKLNRSERSMYRDVREIEKLGWFVVDRERKPTVVHWVASSD